MVLSRQKRTIVVVADLLSCIRGQRVSPYRLQEIFGAPPWSQQRSGRGSHRAIVFLDPFGMSVKWETLKQLAETRAVDVWYLFPTGAVNRQLAGDFARVDEHKQGALDEVFGSTAWRADIYKAKIVQGGFFDKVVTTATKTFTVDQIERYAQDQLTTIFGYVSDPMTLLNDRDSKIFSLFCLSNSSSPKALALIKKGVIAVQKKFGGRWASHRMFYH
jgi:three-Cys-motif partner protein